VGELSFSNQSIDTFGQMIEQEQVAFFDPGFVQFVPVVPANPKLQINLKD